MIILYIQSEWHCWNGDFIHLRIHTYIYNNLPILDPEIYIE